MILLDTHVMVWLDLELHRIGDACAERLTEAEALNEIAFSAATIWELTFLIEKGKVILDTELPAWREEWLAAEAWEVPFDGPTFLQAAGLVAFHADPADRLIVATALMLDAELVTADERILAWEGSLRRRDARI